MTVIDTRGVELIQAFQNQLSLGLDTFSTFMVEELQRKTLVLVKHLETLRVQNEVLCHVSKDHISNRQMCCYILCDTLKN